MQGSHDYVCPATNNCTIDRNRRKSCQACRFSKCVVLGMADHYTKKERRRRRKKRKPNEEEPTVSKVKKEEADTPLNSVKTILARDEEAANFLDMLISIEPPARMTEHDYSQPTTDTGLIASMIRLADKQLMDTIQWAKRIPGYRKLALNDQIKLLDSAWLDILICGVAFKSMGVSKNILIMADDFHWSRPQADISGAGIAHEHMRRLSRRFADVGITKEENVLLRTMFLLNADAEGLECAEQVREMHNLIIEALKVATRRSERTREHQDDKYRNYIENRVSHILLLLPHVKNCANNCMAHLFDAKYEGKMPTCELIEDILHIRLRPTATATAQDQSGLAGIAAVQGFVGRGYPGLPLMTSTASVQAASLDLLNSANISAGDIMNANISAVITRQMAPENIAQAQQSFGWPNC
ncbi:DgyrCDS614 [Dimorphilus gyrociliatus]|nr:DgyrCDS614 [Dimorphilus gyrociliatus]